jgi:hypothetical protein
VTDGPEHKHEGEGHLIRTLTAASILIALIGAAVSLLFHLAPNLEPCVGGASAAFTGAPVFPRVRFRDYLIRDGAAREDAAAQPNLYGAEVRFSYRADNLRGAQLPLVWSLVTIGKGGVVNAVVPGQDRALAMTVTPDRCGDTGGKDLFVQIGDPNRRYRVVLELYRDQLRADRLALVETPTFQG